jgi:hypothetical protein
MRFLSRLFRGRAFTSPPRPQSLRRQNRTQLGLETLEDRVVPSTVSSIASNFNGTAIPAGGSIWFNSAFKASGLGAGPVAIHVTNQVISFSAGGTSYNVNVPDSILNFSAANTVATTGFDAGQNAWVTNLPMSWSGNAFLGGATFVAAGGLPGGINPVTWTGNFATDTAGVSLNWQWGAAVYTSFGSDYNALNVKPLDSNSATLYQNSDHAGTPEAFRSFVIGGARGGGGSNWTGSYSGTAKVNPDVESFAVQQTASLSGFFQGTTGGADKSGVLITLTGTTASGKSVSLTTYTAAADGSYSFTGLQAGIYTLTVTLPPAVFSTYEAGATAGTVNGNLDGTNNNPIDAGQDASIANINLSAGDNGINFNFNDFPPGI